jgi:hypothetical protein
MWMIRIFQSVILGVLITFPAIAETPILRIGTHLRTSDGSSYLQFQTAEDAIRVLNNDLRLFVNSVDDCTALLTVPAGQEDARDSLRQTTVIIQKLRILCWALFQVPSRSVFSPADDADRMTPDIMWTIMRYVTRLESLSDANFKTFLSFPEGAITCRNVWQCRLVRPDEAEHTNDIPEQMVGYELIFAIGDTRFVMVTQMIYGRAGFMYGVRLEGGEVVEVFPVLG